MEQYQQTNLPPAIIHRIEQGQKGTLWALKAEYKDIYIHLRDLDASAMKPLNTLTILIYAISTQKSRSPAQLV